MNEGCGRKIRSRDAGLYTMLADKMKTLRKTASDEELKDLITLMKAHPVEYSCCTIVRGDCWKHMPNLPKRFFDLIVADPPYGMNIKGWQKHHANADWDDKGYPEHIVKTMIGIARLGSYFFCRWDNLKQNITLPKPKSMLVWTKQGIGGGTGDLSHEHIRDYEMAYFYPGPEHRFKDSKRPPSIFKCKPPGNDVHQTQKPVQLIKDILRWYDFETVFDPFMGSGTTAVAAKELGKHFFGFERDKDNHRDAIERIAEIDK